jgi:hypothetical protein
LENGKSGNAITSFGRFVLKVKKFNVSKYMHAELVPMVKHVKIIHTPNKKCI